MAQGIDFTAMIRGARTADNNNWQDIQRIQEQQNFAIKREDDLANLQTRRTQREAATYLSTVMPNLNRLADQGLNPTDALISQLSAIKADTHGMNPAVQTAILEGLGGSAAMQMQVLAKSNDYEGMKKLAAAFGSPNPVDALGAAITSGDPNQILAAVNARAPGTAMLSPDKQSVINPVTGQRVPVNDYIAQIAAARNAAGGLNAFQQQEQTARTQAAAGVIKTEEKQREQQAAQLQIAMLHQVNPSLVLPDIMYTSAGLPVPGTTMVPGTGPFAGVTGSVVSGEANAAPGAVEARLAGATPAVPGATPTVPGATPTVPGATPAELPTGAIQQLSAQIATANAGQLQTTLTALTAQVQKADQERQQLDALQTQLMAQIKSQPTDPFGGISPGMQKQLEQLQQIEFQYAKITESQNWRKHLLEQINNKYQQLQVPGLVLPQPTDSASSFAELQKAFNP